MKGSQSPRYGQGREAPRRSSRLHSASLAQPPTKATAEESRKEHIVDDVLAAMKDTITVVGNFADLAPGAQGVMSTLERMLDMVMKARDNDKEAQDVVDGVKSLVIRVKETMMEIGNRRSSPIYSVLSPDHDNTHAPALSYEWLGKAIDELAITVKQLEIRAEEIKKPSLFIRAFRSGQNVAILRNIKDDLERANNEFQSVCIIHIGTGVEDLKAQVGKLDTRTQMVDQWIDDRDTEDVLNRLSHRDHAEFSSPINVSKSEYLQDTRKALLIELEDWATDRGARPPIFILSGAAGTGKSTIAYELARRLKGIGRLGASFFFVSGDEDLSCTTYVFPSIAYQLARLQPHLRSSIACACRYSLPPGDLNDLRFQLLTYIIKPLQKVKYHPYPIVLIIDALDECTQLALERVPLMLHILLKEIYSSSIPLRIVLTTRPEMHIEQIFASGEFDQVTRPFRLHDIHPEEANGDIRRYLSVKFQALGPAARQLLLTRPEVIDALTMRAEGLFIYCTTILRTLREDPYHLVEVIDSLLSDSPTANMFGLVYLNSLYSKILESAFSFVFFKKGIVKPVLGVIALLNDHISPKSIASLLGIPIADIRSVISRMGSLVLSDQSDDEPIRPLHASFPQFLIDPERCTNHEFCVQPRIYHGRLAIACLSALNMTEDFRRNILRLPDLMVHKTTIADLTTITREYLPSHLQYACKHWMAHLHEAEPSSELLEQFAKFTKHKLLAWVEALSILDRLDVAVQALPRVQAWAKRANEVAMAELLHDIYRLVLENFTAINVCPGQVYITGLALLPRCRLLQEHSSQEFINLLTPRDAQWGACLRVLEGHSGYVYAAAFSPNGQWIVSASSDKTLRMWDTKSGALFNTLEGHSGYVQTVDVSPVGENVVSGSHVGEIHIWNAASGALIRAHTHLESMRISNAHSVTCSPRKASQTFAAFVTAYQEHSSFANVNQNIQRQSDGDPEVFFLCIWNLLRGQLIHMVAVEAKLKNITFSEDGTMLAAGGWDRSVRIWNATTLEPLMSLCGHTSVATSVAFIPSTQRIVSGSSDTTLRVWDTRVERCLRVLQGHAYPINAVSASTRGDYIASGSSDDTVRLWDSHSGDCFAILHGHMSWVTSVSFSPDSTRLISASSNCTLRIWDLQTITEASGRATNGHSSAVCCMTFSPKRPELASCLRDGTIHVWGPMPQRLHNASGGVASDRGAAWTEPNGSDAWEIKQAMSWGTGLISQLSFSADGAVLAAGGEAYVRLWSTSDYALIRQIKLAINGYDRLYHLELSSDGQQIFARFRYYMMSAVWSSSNGALLEYVEDERENGEVDEQRFHQEAGWIVDRLTGHKLCWLPEARRGQYAASIETCNGNYYACGSTSGNVTILNLSKALFGYTGLLQNGVIGAGEVNGMCSLNV